MGDDPGREPLPGGIVTIRVEIERMADGARHHATVSHPTSMWAAWVQASHSCWAAFGKPPNFGYDYRVSKWEDWP